MPVISASSAAGCVASSRRSRSRSARSVSDCELTETYSPAAMESEPATRPAMAAINTAPRSEWADATPTTRLLVEIRPSLAPSTAARSQPMCSVRWNSRCGMRASMDPSSATPKHPLAPSRRLRRLGLQLLDQLGEHALGIAEEHHRLGIVVELVVDPGEAGLEAALDDDDVARLVDVEDRHAVDRARLVVTSRGIDDVVGAHHQHHVGALELGVDLLEVVELLV